MYGKKICLMILTIMIILYTKGRVLASNAKEEIAVPAPQLFAQSAALIDGETGRVLFGKQEDTVLPMASTTKIMTCILALENASPDDVVNVSDYAASMPDVQLHIRKGETYRMEDLLYSLMLES
ncbi:MAG: D-alanyl-D-alanine carboxypeptidase, partial [Lachnospiraceae bacterium]|nr:D-alanyl-D-alanine carboxypeptidase [Lachnospiraceae bacterium]